MRVISIVRLRAFWEGAEQKDAEGPIWAWYTHVSNRRVSWNSWGDVKADYSNASLVGNCVVFNIGGNKYRLVTRILYANQKIFILKVMTHAEYDDDKWKCQCGCFEPPPKLDERRYHGDQEAISKRKMSNGEQNQIWTQG